MRRRRSLCVPGRDVPYASLLMACICLWWMWMSPICADAMPPDTLTVSPRMDRASLADGEEAFIVFEFQNGHDAAVTVDRLDVGRWSTDKLDILGGPVGLPIEVPPQGTRFAVIRVRAERVGRASIGEFTVDTTPPDCHVSLTPTTVSTEIVPGWTTWLVSYRRVTITLLMLGAPLLSFFFVTLLRPAMESWVRTTNLIREIWLEALDALELQSSEDAGKHVAVIAEFLESATEHPQVRRALVQKYGIPLDSLRTQAQPFATSGEVGRVGRRLSSDLVSNLEEVRARLQWRGRAGWLFPRSKWDFGRPRPTGGDS